MTTPARIRRGGPGRPTMLTREIGDRIVARVESGMYLEQAAMLEGFAADTVRKWVRNGRKPDAAPLFVDFADRMVLALSKLEQTMVQKVIAASDSDPRFATWFLERRFPSRWGRKDEKKITAEPSAGRVIFVSNGRGPAPALLPAGDDAEDVEVLDG